MSKQKPKKKSTKGANPLSNKPLAKARHLPAFLYNKKLISGFIFLLSFGLYFNTLGYKYTQDDAIVIYDNMYTTQGIKGIGGLLKYDTFKGFFKEEGKDKLVSGGRYRPLTPIMFALEWQLFKKAKKDVQGNLVKDDKGDVVYEGRPAVGHFLNIVFYGLTGIVLYLLLLKLLLPRYGRDFAYFVALLTTVLFVAHPIHTEAVANIKGRDEIMALLGSLGAAYFCLRAFRKDSMKWSIVAAVIFFLSLLSKENTITFLAVIPLMFWFFTKAKMSDIIKQTVPLLGATLLFLIIRGGILGWSLGEPSMELMNNPYLKIVDNKWVHFSFSEKMATIFYTLGMYIKLLIFPHPLTHDYYPRQVGIMSWSNWQSILSLLLYLAMGVFAVMGLRKKNILSFGILFFLATLSIVSNIVFAVGTNMSERFVFMPSVGFCLVVAVLAYRLAFGKGRDELSRKPQLLTVVGALAIVVVSLFGVKTIFRNMAWKDNFTLFTTDIKTSSNSAKLLNAVGAELGIRASSIKNETEKKLKLQESLGYLNQAIKIHPTYKNTYLQLGNVSNYLKDYENAIKYYQQVLRMNANDKNGMNNLGITYREAGKYYGEQGNVQKAMEYLNKAREMRGDEYEIIRLLGVANGISGNHTKAIEFFTKATQLEPNNADAFWNLGNAWYYAGDQVKADQFRTKAKQMDPNAGQQKQQ